MRAFNIIFGVLSILCGIFCLMNPFSSAIIYEYVLAVFIGVWGLFGIISFFVIRSEQKKQGAQTLLSISALLLGILALIFGICHFTIPSFGLSTQGVLAVLLCIYLLIDGVLTIVKGFTTAELTTGMKVLTVILGIFLILAAIAGLANIWLTISVFGMFLGIGFLFKGVAMIASV